MGDESKQAEEAAERFGVPGTERRAFAELFLAAQEAGRASDANLQRWREHLAQSRAEATVREHMEEHATEIGAAVQQLLAARGSDVSPSAPPEAGREDRLRCSLEQRLVFSGVYGVGLSLDESLQRVLGEVEQASALKLAADSSPLELRVESGVFDERHARIRRSAYPYRPACTAGEGDPVTNCVCSDGALAGYIAMHGSYADDLAVDPKFHGCGVAKTLVREMAAGLKQQGSSTMSLDVRALNLPAIEFYKRMGFKIQEKRYPAFYDWHGGFRMEAWLDSVRS